jgi:hypothetical protein
MAEVARPASLQTRPIDDAARNGGYQLVLCSEGTFWMARWADGVWLCSTGLPILFEPVEYRPHPDPLHG